MTTTAVLSFSLTISHHHHHKLFTSTFHHHNQASTITTTLKPISASLNPNQIIPSSASPIIPANPSPPQTILYQPFRPPPSPLPSQYRSLDIAARLDVLANRLGLWFEYAPLISSLIQEGFTPPTIEEATGISGVEQNRLVVAAKVRESLVQSNTDPELVAAFDTGGAELLYEIRLLSASQRAAAAAFIIREEMDAEGARDVARAIKDFPRRRGEKGWEKFDYNSPGDCLSFMYFRQSREHWNPSEARTAALASALRTVETEGAKSAVLEELEGKKDGESEKEVDVDDGIRVPVVRLQFGEVAEASSVVVLPVCQSEQIEGEINEAPWESKGQGEFGVVVAEKGWARWVVLPGWKPIVGLNRGGVAVAFPDARVLPWKVNRWYNEESVLVLVNRGSKEVEADDGFYLVGVNGGDGRDGLKVERGSRLKQIGVVESLGSVVLVVRPPREETDDQLSDEDWE